MQLMICVTTMNRPHALQECLAALAACRPAPLGVIVSDDSSDPAIIASNRALVSSLPGAELVAGPRRGVCANRNNALRIARLKPGVSHIAFVDDDIQLHPDFVGVAQERYRAASESERRRTILTGGNMPPSRLSFRGYFEAAERPECVDIHAAVFPVELFRDEAWDENIFFGSEDAELCLRALRRGFSISHVEALRSEDGQPNAGVLMESPDAGLSKYQRYCQAARLYIGIKRYRSVTPNFLKLCGFIAFYFLHLSIYLLRRKALGELGTIVRAANLKKLAHPADSPQVLFGEIGH